jgi:hypothetical protein
MGGIETAIFLLCGVTVAAMACFCAMVGYLVGIAQKVVPAIERIEKTLDQMAKQTNELANFAAPDAVPPLPAGMYMPEDVGGLTRLAPLTDDRRG